MSVYRTHICCLLATSALGLVAGAGTAWAQAPAEGLAVGEVVVTATRRSDTVHNVPMAITAVTPQDLERRGLRRAEDLTQAVTSLRISPVNSGGAGGGAGNPDIAIRGIRSTTGAPTTGIYINDVPLQQRNLSLPTGGGTNLPNLFDLERVEVLRGPQGTLYGGSSQGGTLRFITPQPSVTRSSIYTRAEIAHTEEGKPSYEFGAAVGAPIVQDKLGVRVSASFREDGGYVDHVSRFTGATIAEDTNKQQHVAWDIGIAWKPTDRSTVTLGWHFQRDWFRDSDNYWEDFPQYTATTFQGSRTYGPYTMFGPYKTGQNTNIGDNFYTSDAQLSAGLAPHTGRMSIPSLTLDYAFDKMNVKSVTALNSVRNAAYPDFSYVDVISRAGTPVEGPFNALPNTSPFIATMPAYVAKFAQTNKIRNLTEEIRFSSNDPESRLSWVAGLYYLHSQLSSDLILTANSNALFRFIAGVPLPTPVELAFSAPQKMKATQLAAFGEATVSVTDKLKVTGGIRYTRDQFSYELRQGGPLFQLPLNTLSAQGTVTESPITPKFGLQYVFNSNANVYANAAKGYRPGGVNSAIPPTCNTFLVAAGYPNGAPPTYGSDTLWSYEGGAKVRTLGGRANINVSVFRIDWNNVQTPIGLACGQNFTVSVAEARSEGADFQGSFQVFPGFTVTANVAYTNARYTSSVFSSPTTALILAGQQIPFTPKWTSNLSGEYRFDVGTGRQAYVRADWSHTGEFFQGLGPGVVSYTPATYRLDGSDIVNARVGMMISGVEVSAFVNNLTKSIDPLGQSGIAGAYGPNTCLNTACTQFVKNSQGVVTSTFRPRTFGLNVSYRR